MTKIEEAGARVVLSPDFRYAGLVALSWTAIGAATAVVGGASTASAHEDFNARFALIAMALFGTWAAAWYGYCLLLPCRVTYVWDGLTLRAFRGQTLVCEVGTHQVAELGWGLNTFSWSSWLTAPWGLPSMPQLLVTVRGETRWDSAPLWFPPICVWGEDALQTYLDELREQFGLTS